MNEYEEKLRDEFAKIAFERLVGDWVQTPHSYKGYEGLGKWAYDLSDNAMQARKAKQEAAE